MNMTTIHLKLTLTDTRLTYNDVFSVDLLQLEVWFTSDNVNELVVVEEWFDAEMRKAGQVAEQDALRAKYWHCSSDTGAASVAALQSASRAAAERFNLQLKVEGDHDHREIEG